MKLPSLTLLIGQVLDTLKRFSVVILFAFICSILFILQNNQPYNIKEQNHWYFNIMMAAALGMLSQIAIVAFSERKQFSQQLKLSLQIIGIGLVILYYFSLPSKMTELVNIRFVLLVLGLHLLIAFVPFTSVKEMNGFWQYNKILLLRFLTSYLYTSVLYIGLSLALLAIDKLFNAKIDGKIFFDLWVVLTGIFNTWFFLAGFPKDFAILEQHEDYPKGLKVFTQYVLLPIITVYLLILYAYMFKIVFTLHWPVGWVSYLVLGFSVAGILSLLLIHPIQNLQNNKWILVFSRFFYFAIFPLLIMLFLAIERRVSDYGITELRYFVLVLALWLLFIASYFLISKHKNIKVIPQSLCLLAFVCSFGPWDAFNVSLRSQQYHFEKLMEKNKLLVNGKLIKSTAKISLNDRMQISSVTEYLLERHGVKTLQPYFNQPLDTMVKSERWSSVEDAEKVLKLLNITYTNTYDLDEENNSFSYKVKSGNTMADVTGFNYYISNYYCRVTEHGKDTVVKRINQDSVVAIYDTLLNSLSIRVNNNIPFIFKLADKTKAFYKQYELTNKKIPEDNMTIVGEDDNYRYKLLLIALEGKRVQDNLNLNYINPEIYIAKKKE